MASVNATSGGNVYILGAGFSRDAGLPLMGDFLEKAKCAYDWLKQEKRASDAQAVAVLLELQEDCRTMKFRVRVDSENIESLFSLASATTDARLVRDCKCAIAAVIDFAAKTSKEPQCRMSVSSNMTTPSWYQLEPMVRERSVYDWYAAVFGEGPSLGAGESDVVITLNYDVTLEAALRRLGIPFGYGLDRTTIVFDAESHWMEEQYSRAGLQILKLHGSLNWLSPVEKPTLMRLPNPTGLDAAAIYSTALYICDDYRGVRQCEYADMLKQDRAPLLIPPTWYKSFGIVLREVWRQALRALRDASRIVIVGFSMPDTDLHIRYLLAAGLAMNTSLEGIWFVNPSETDLAKAHGRFGDITPICATTADFFFDGSWLSKIARNPQWLSAEQL